MQRKRISCLRVCLQGDGVMGSALQEFESAVLLTFDQAAPAPLRDQAVSSLEALKASDSGVSFCLQALSVTGEACVKFWCLQVLVDLVRQGLRCEAHATSLYADVWAAHTTGCKRIYQPSALEQE